MRSLDSVLFSLDEDTTDKVRKLTQTGQRYVRSFGRRLIDELSLVGMTLSALLVATAVCGGLAALCRWFAGESQATEYLLVLVVPVFAVLGAALLTIALRLSIEPRRVGRLALLCVAACAYPGAWIARVWISGGDVSLVGSGAVELVAVTRASELAGLPIPAALYFLAEAAVTTVGGLALTRLYLGQQPASVAETKHNG